MIDRKSLKLTCQITTPKWSHLSSAWCDAITFAQLVLTKYPKQPTPFIVPCSTSVCTFAAEDWFSSRELKSLRPKFSNIYKVVEHLMRVVYELFKIK